MAAEPKYEAGYYWALIDGAWEVVEIDCEEDGRADMSRAGSDVPVSLLADGSWSEWGSPLEVSKLIGPLVPPNA